MSEPVHERIERIQRECRQPGWYDGGGDAVHPFTANLAHKLADVLPDAFPAPGNEGDFEFEWDADGGTYIVSVLFVPTTPKAG